MDGLRERLLRQARDGFLNGNPNRQAILTQLDTLFKADSNAYSFGAQPKESYDPHKPQAAVATQTLRDEVALTRANAHKALTALGIDPSRQSVLQREYEVIRLGGVGRISEQADTNRDARIYHLQARGYIKTGPGTLFADYENALAARRALDKTEFGSTEFRKNATAIDASMTAAAKKMGISLQLAGAQIPQMVLNRESEFKKIYAAGRECLFNTSNGTPQIVNVFSLPPLPVPNTKPGQTNSFTMLGSVVLSGFATKAINDDLKNTFENGECPEESNMGESFAKIYFLQADTALRDKIWLSCAVKKRKQKLESSLKNFSDGKFKALKTRSTGITCKNLPGSDIGVQFLIDKPARRVQFKWGPDHKFTMMSVAPQEGTSRTFSYSTIQQTIHYGTFTESHESVSTRAGCTTAIGQSLSGCSAEVLDTLKKSAKSDDPKSTATPNLENPDLESFYLLEAAMVVAESHPDTVKTPAAFCEAMGGTPPEGGFTPPHGVDRSPHIVVWPDDSSTI